MPTATYIERRTQLEDYFDRTAVEAWKKLTSDAPVGRIRATVRAGRDQMRTTLLDYLPCDLSGRRILDAGCGTGALAIEAARRGADVVAIDLSSTLVGLAHERSEMDFGSGHVQFLVGDMLDPQLGQFDHVVAMDSLIHYTAPDVVRVLSGLVARTSESVVFTFAPRTLPLAAMHAVGRLLPQSNRAPAIEPVAPEKLIDLLETESTMSAWMTGRTARVGVGFYTSQALELMRR
jgi:magnesium-protoporphyrin O-methyltransferase